MKFPQRLYWSCLYVEISLIQLMYFNLALEMHYVKKKARELIVKGTDGWRLILVQLIGRWMCYWGLCEGEREQNGWGLEKDEWRQEWSGCDWREHRGREWRNDKWSKGEETWSSQSDGDWAEVKWGNLVKLDMIEREVKKRTWKENCAAVSGVVLIVVSFCIAGCCHG